MKFIIKKIIFFLKIILKLDQLNSVELSGKLSNYSQLKFLPKTPLYIPFNLGRTVRGISFEYLDNINLGENKKDLIGKQYIDLINNVPHETVIKNVMFLMKKEENMTAADIMNCPNNQYLNSFPAWASVLPWEKLSIKNKFDNYLRSFIKNRTKHGAKFVGRNGKLTKKEIYSEDVVISHVKQITKLISVIRKKGIKKTNNLPRVFILINKNNQWSWIMSTEGNHRAYLFYLLGLKKFPIIIEDVIYRESLKFSYNVKNGLYTLKEAENIFDGISNGNFYIRGLI